MKAILGILLALVLLAGLTYGLAVLDVYAWARQLIGVPPDVNKSTRLDLAERIR